MTNDINAFESCLKESSSLKKLYKDLSAEEMERLLDVWNAGRAYERFVCGIANEEGKGLSKQEFHELGLVLRLTDCVDASPDFYWQRRRELMRKATDEEKEAIVKEMYEE